MFISEKNYKIYNSDFKSCQTDPISSFNETGVGKGNFDHYIQGEILNSLILLVILYLDF